MKRALVLSAVFVFAVELSARAAVTFQPVLLVSGDTIQFQGQTPNESQGRGGAFTWEVIADDTANGVSSSPGTYFQTFCTQLTQSISATNDYTVTSVTNSPAINSALNTTGNSLQNYAGLYLFDLWNKGLLASSDVTYGTANVAGAVQVQIWLSEGYTSTQISTSSGIFGTTLTNDEFLANTLLSISDTGNTGTSYATFSPTDIAAVDLNNLSGQGAQDQVLLIPSSGTSSSGQPTAPEPTGIIVWGIGAGVAGAAAVRRRGQRRTRWTKQNRQAILAVIDRGRQRQKS